MPKARYLTTFRNGRPDVPANVFADRTEGYGWRVITHAPWSTCILEVITTQEVIDNTDANAAFIRIEEGEAQQSWKARTTGGSGGEVIHVTTLAASGTGSLAEALAAEMPRIIVFDVAGTIDLIGAEVYTLTVDNPHITIDGSSAPEGGITLKGRLTIRTHDVIVQHLRIRPGADPVKGLTNGIVLTDTVESYPYNIWIDHCSLSWSTDENLTIYPTFGHVIENVEVSYCLIYEALNNSTHPEGAHSMNMLLSNGWRDVAIHHCLFAHAVDRNPQIGAGIGIQARLVFANNIVYNVNEPLWLWGGVEADIVSNVFKRVDAYYDVELSSQISTVASSQVHIEGNTNVGRTFTVRHSGANNAPDYPRASLRLTTPPMLITSAVQAYTDVLMAAGATPRDAIDARIIADVQNGTGEIIDHPDDVEGWI